MSNPTVSVCIPAYNASKTIGKTIESVLASTYQDFEIVVVDNASTDVTADIVRSYDDPRISLSVNDENYGPRENWNRAVAATTGRYVKLVCADDRIDPDCLAKQVAVFEDPANEGVVMVAARRVLVDDQGKQLMKARGLSGMEGRIAGQRAIRIAVRSGTNPFGEAAAVLLQGDIIRKSLPWSDKHPYMIDVEMWLRILEQGDLFAIPETLAEFTVATNSWSGEIMNQQRQQAIGLLKDVRSRHPESVSAFDVAFGGAQATALNYGRRVVYAWMRKRASK